MARFILIEDKINHEEILYRVIVKSTGTCIFESFDKILADGARKGANAAFSYIKQFITGKIE